MVNGILSKVVTPTWSMYYYLYAVVKIVKMLRTVLGSIVALAATDYTAIAIHFYNWSKTE